MSCRSTIVSSSGERMNSRRKERRLLSVASARRFLSRRFSSSVNEGSMSIRLLANSSASLSQRGRIALEQNPKAASRCCSSGSAMPEALVDSRMDAFGCLSRYPSTWPRTALASLAGSSSRPSSMSIILLSCEPTHSEMVAETSFVSFPPSVSTLLTYSWMTSSSADWLRWLSERSLMGQGT